jgi:peptide/nickel transport system substrate-binding protein
MMKSWSILIVLFLAGCSSSHDSASIRFGLAVAPITLDPRYATDAESSRLNRLLYNALIDFDDQLKPIPKLATWKQISPLHYRFILDKADLRYFHHGQTLSAQDVKATFQSILDPNTASPHRGTLNIIQEIQLIDNNTIDFFLNKPNPLFPSLLNIGILPANLIEQQHPFNKQPVGSGAFKFLAWKNTGEIYTERRHDHQQVIFIPIKDPLVRVLKFLHGELDILQGSLPIELITYLQQKKAFQFKQIDGSNFAYLGFNLQDQYLSNILIRKAISYAIDRESIIKYVLGNAAHLANAVLPPYHWAGNPHLTGFSYQPEQAKALLKQAGFSPEHPLKLSFKTSVNPLSLRFATVLQQQFKEVGIELSLNSYDWGTFYSDIKAGKFQLFSLSWIGIKTPDIFRHAFHSSAIPPIGANRGRFQDAFTDYLIESAEAQTTLEEQAAIYQQLQSHLLEILPYLPLWYEDQYVFLYPNLSKYQLFRDGRYDGLLTIQKQV